MIFNDYQLKYFQEPENKQTDEQQLKHSTTLTHTRTKNK